MGKDHMTTTPANGAPHSPPPPSPPNPTTKPTSTPSSQPPQTQQQHPPPISELINESPPTPTSMLFSTLHSSKHNPDFHARNHQKALALSTILSNLQLHLSAAQRAQDQPAFDELYARIGKAGEGLEDFARGWEGLSEEGEAGERGFGQFMRVGWREDWWVVRHGRDGEEGERHGELSAERLRRAKAVYEEMVLGGEMESDEQDEDEMGRDGGVSVCCEMHDADQNVAFLREGVQCAGASS